MRKTTTSRIKSHIRHVVYRISTVHILTRDVVYRGFTALDLARGGSHTVVYINIYGKVHFLGKTRNVKNSHENYN